MALIDKITAIANAIRDKTGTTDPLTLDQMAIAIAEFKVGGGTDDYGKLVYQLPEPLHFDGTNFVETGVPLFNEAGEFTICMDFSSEVTSGNAMLVHCMHEESPFYGMHLFTSSYVGYPNSWMLTHYGKLFNINVTPYSTDRRRIVIRGSTNPDANMAGGTVGDNYTSASVSSPSSSYKTFAPIEETVLIGAQRLVTGDFQNYWKGNLYDFKIFKRQISNFERGAYLNSGSLL